MAMMTTKLNVKDYSSTPQQSSLKNEVRNRTSVDETGIPEGKDMGTFLNEVADPNYVPPEKLRRVGKKDLDKDAFLQLMLAQIKNQDPMNPTKSDQMAAQLAQFSSVEQLMNMNTKMDGLTKTQTPISQYQALNFIGRSVAADSSKIIRNIGDKAHDLRFSLVKDAEKVKLNVKNEEGDVVRTYEMNKLKKGDNSISWNGLDGAGNSLKAGNYFLEIEGEDAFGGKVAARTAFEGKVTGINYTSDGVVLMVGDQSIRLNDVSKIEDSELKSEQKAKDAVPALKNPDQALQDGMKDIQGAKPAYKGNIDSLAMSQQVWDQKNQAREAVKAPTSTKGDKSGT